MKRPEPRGRNDSHVFDYSKINDCIYIGSDFCKGRTCPVHDKQFHELGVTVELNLSAEKNEKPPEDIGMYSWIPVVDGYAPAQKQLDVGSAMINEAVNIGETVYVHCKNGHARSPTMVAAYLVRFQKMGVDEAIDYIAKRRPEIHVEKTQQNALKEFAGRYKDM